MIRTNAMIIELFNCTGSSAMEISMILCLKKFVDQVYHIENDSLFQLNPAEYPTIPNYIIQLCDTRINSLEENLNNS